MTDKQRAKLRDDARKVAESAPPLTPDQQLRLAALLRPDLPVGIQQATNETAAARSERGKA